MQIQTLYRIIKWFNDHQPNLTNKEGIRLYENLVNEEILEREQALENKDLVEFLDGVGDTILTTIGLLYYNNTDLYRIETETDKYSYALIRGCNIKGDLDHIINELLNIIADSNNTKELAQQTEGEKKFKVIKGDNFVPPTEGIKKLIEKYNITFKD